MRGIEDQTELAVIVLFSDKPRREVIDYFLTDVGDGWVSKGEIDDNVDVSGEAVRTKIEPFMKYGVIEVRNSDANIPHYRLAETAVTDILRTWDGYPLVDLFEFRGAQKLVRFFLTEADPTKPYSFSSIDRDGSVGYHAASNNMETLVDAGLVEEVEGTRSTEYRLDNGSAMYQCLVELNDAVYHEYEYSE